MSIPTHILMLILAGLLVLAAVGGLLVAIRRRNLHYWIGSYYFPSHRDEQREQITDIFLAVCDHYEPEFANPGKERAVARVERWRVEYPKLFSKFRDSSGRPPQHTFFFPQDQYAPEYLDILKEICELGYGDVDVHLHHDQDTAQGLRDKLESFRESLYHRHGLLRRNPRTQQICYGFIHGNWALCNARPDGRWCGVDQELSILMETGCYADFTMPCAPNDSQTRTINSIYYAKDILGRRKSHDTGMLARVGEHAPPDSLLMIQGPLMLDWRRRKFGVLPRIENSDLHGRHPGDLHRLKLWLNANVHVRGRPEWKFIKLHTHGCNEANMKMLLGEEMQQFHECLAKYMRENQAVRLHYVTAWEMAERVHLAESGAPIPATMPITELSKS